MSEHPIIVAARIYVATRDEHETRGPLLAHVRNAHQQLIDTVRAHPAPTAPNTPESTP